MKFLLLLVTPVTLSFSAVISPMGDPGKNDEVYDFHQPKDFEKRQNYDIASSGLPENPCQQLQEDWVRYSITKGEPYEEQDLRVTLVWEGAEGQIAAALLRATLIAAGYNNNRVKMYHRGSKDSRSFSNHTVLVEVTTAPQLHVRLTLRVTDLPVCKKASILPFYEDDEILQKCDFWTSDFQHSGKVIVYVVNEWERTCGAEIITQFAATNYAWMEVVYLEHTHLTHLINESDRSFYFIDAKYWSDSQNVRIAQVPENVAAAAQCIQNINKTVSLKVDDEFSPALSEMVSAFSPNPDDLNDVKKILHFGIKYNMTTEEAACQFALQAPRQFSQWRKAAVVKPVLRKVAVIICRMEVQDLNEYIYLKGLIENSKEIFSANSNIEQRIQIQLFCIDCFDTNWLFRKLLNWFNKNVVSEIAGVILTEDIAIAAAPLAEKFQLPLLTYDVSSNKPVVHSATGRLKHLELALRRLLDNCGWRRLAIISEKTRLAASLSAALRDPTASLAVRDVNVTSLADAESVKRTLKELLKAKAKVFLLNTGSSTAATVLAIARELNITWDNGFTWILREYNVADNATAVTRPYSISFWWRGHVENETKEYKMYHNIYKNINVYKDNNGGKEVNRENLREKFENRWRKRVWPLYAAPLLDALLTLGEGLKHLNSNSHNTWLNDHRDGSLRKLWDSIERKNIPGILQNLSYDKYGVSAPLVFVQQWGAEPRPRLLATWRSGEWRKAGETCPTTDLRDDGFAPCLMPTGDPFVPNCKDAVWLTVASFAMIACVALIVLVIQKTRLALLARDKRVKTEFAKRLLERRERVFAALADHLIERSQLELLQELGKGRFGRVHLGILRESGRKFQHVVVAAKALREEAAPAEESEFLREACMLAALNHEHIVHFVGVCIVDGPPLLLMEHAFFGDLLQYLQTRRYLTDGKTNEEINFKGVGLDEKAYVSAEALTKLAREAASALAYIAERGIVHRDLRASNCLVDERRSLKLADFGLARATGTVDGEYACRRGLFPVLWMAPESLATGVSTVASDVWSFGVLVFELVTLGQRPYGSEPPPSVLRRVLAGGRPQLPWDASAETRALVRACWRRTPEARPTAARLADWLSTRWRALRPTLVTEFVDIDNQVYGNNDTDDFALGVSDTTISNAIKQISPTATTSI